MTSNPPATPNGIATAILPTEAPNCVPDCTNCRLRALPAFLPLGKDELLFVRAFRHGAVSVPAGGAVIREQQPNGKLYTVYEGWAFRYKTLKDGRRQILNFLLPGDLVGLQQQFSDGAMHGVEAVTDVRLCSFPREGLWELYHQHPNLGYDITWLAARGEGMVDDNLLTAGRRNAIERVAMLLMHLYRRMERLALVQDGWIDFPINQQHIADALGLSLVHTNKTLRRLQQLGLHELQNGRLRLMNPKALVRIADYYDAPLQASPLL